MVLIVASGVAACASRSAPSVSGGESDAARGTAARQLVAALFAGDEHRVRAMIDPNAVFPETYISDELRYWRRHHGTITAAPSVAGDLSISVPYRSFERQDAHHTSTARGYFVVRLSQGHDRFRVSYFVAHDTFETASYNA